MYNICNLVMPCSVGAYLSINGDPIPNNSNISINAIGEGPNEALLCLTDFYHFFNDSDAIENIGRWYYLNGSAVTLDTNNDIYMSNDGGVVRLHRKNNAVMPTGIFRCEILNSNKTRQSIYVEVYYESTSITGSSPINMVGAGVSGAVLGGAAVGGILLISVITAGILLAIIYAIRR